MTYAARVAPSRFPKMRGLLPSLNFELTERCNNNCVHCCINQPADSPVRRSESSTEEIKRILNEGAELGCMYVRFTGGEPLLREDFDELYLFARRLGLSVSLFTNARLITPERAALFARFPPRAPIEITVYGMTEASYEAVSRSPGSFHEFRRGVALLEENHIQFFLKTVLLPQNRQELAGFTGWALQVNPGARPPQVTTVLDLRHRRDDEGRNRLIASLRPTPEEIVAHLARDANAYREDMKRFCSRSMGAHGERLFACGACHGGCVDSYGCLQPCLGLRAPETGYTLENGSLRHALTVAFPHILKRRATNTDYLKRCARCFLKGLCEQCPAKSWVETGTLDTPVQYYCDIAHAQARYLGILGAGEKAWALTNGRERIEMLVNR